MRPRQPRFTHPCSCGGETSLLIEHRRHEGRYETRQSNRCAVCGVIAFTSGWYGHGARDVTASVVEPVVAGP